MSLLAADSISGVRRLASSSSVLLDAYYHSAGCDVNMGKYCHASCCPSRPGDEGRQSSSEYSHVRSTTLVACLESLDIESRHRSRV
jgi:hypothetical protein